MQIVIEIDNEHYERIMRLEEGVTVYPTTLALYEAVKNGTPLEAQPNRCDSCIYSEERNGSNCYECVKGMADNFEAQPTDMCDCKTCTHSNNGKCAYSEECHECMWESKYESQPTEMRDATEEERKSVKDYIESISKPTGVHFYEAQPTDAVDKRSLDSVIDTLQTWIRTADDEYDREEYWRVQGLREALQEIKKIKTFESSTNVVDRDAVIKLVKYSLCDLKRDADKQIFINTVNSLPSVTSQRMQGEWIEVFVETPNDPYRYGFKAHKCSKCEYRPFQISDYCPNCGAEMMGGGEE